MNISHNISIHDQVETYKKMMEALTTEKEGVTEEIKKRRHEKTYQFAKSLFVYSGNDDKLVEQVNSYLKKITSVKPGRKLVKSLAKMQCKIKIQQQLTFFFNSQALTVSDTPISTINTINLKSEKRGVKTPDWLCFAHELVHALHYYSNPTQYMKNCNTKIDILPAMETFEEQWAITGFASQLFTQPIKPEDVICENAFYIALGLPARVDHDHGLNNLLSESETPSSYKTYYSYLEAKLTYISKIPDERKDDKDFLLTFLADYPSAAKTLSDELMNDHPFMAKLYNKDKRILRHFTELKKDHDFIQLLMESDDWAFFYADKELLKSKEFLLKAMDAMDLERDNYLKEAIINILDESLKQDPEIVQKLGISVQ